MTRSSFLKSIFALAIAPKVIAQLAIRPPIKTLTNAQLFNDLNFLIPDYHKRCVEKYGNENYTMFMELLSTENERNKSGEYFHFEK